MKANPAEFWPLCLFMHAVILSYLFGFSFCLLHSWRLKFFGLFGHHEFWCAYFLSQIFWRIALCSSRMEDMRIPLREGSKSELGYMRNGLKTFDKRRDDGRWKTKSIFGVRPQQFLKKINQLLIPESFWEANRILFIEKCNNLILTLPPGFPNKILVGAFKWVFILNYLVQDDPHMPSINLIYSWHLHLFLEE